MTADPKAPGAAAVYLEIQDSADDELHSRIYYARIKILQESGKEAAKVEVPYFGNRDANRDLATLQMPYQDTSMLLSQPSIQKGKGRSISDFKARVIHKDGSVIPLEGKLEDLLKLETSSQNTIHAFVNVPGVEIGSVLEYRYVERYDGFYTSPQWEIQHNYFVHKAHYTFLPYKSFRPGTMNQVGSYLVDRQGVQLNFLLFWPHLPAGAELKRDSGGRFLLDISDVPAAPQYEWMPPSESQLYRVRFYYRSNSDAKDFWGHESKQWAKEVDHIAEPTTAIREAVAGIIANSDTDLDKARKLYKAVQSLTNTDFTVQKASELGSGTPTTKRASESRTIERRAEDTWTQKSGTSQDIALLYLAMVRAAGLTAYDMKVVNRDRGMFAPDYLYFDQLDDDIILVTINGKEVLLDPGQRMCPFQLVHWKHAGAGGVRENAEGGAIATSPLQPYSANTLVRIGDVNVDVQGRIQGSFRFVMSGQQALHWRQVALQNENLEVKTEFDDWLKSIAPAGVEVHVDRFEALNDPDENLVAIVNVKGSFGTEAAKEFQLPAFFFENRAHHPFIDQANRIVSIDMKYGEQVKDQVTYHLPGEMKVEGSPQDTKIPLGDRAILVVKTVSEPNKIIVARSLARSFTFAKPDEYDSLRSFYQKVASTDQQYLIISSTNSQGAN